MKPKSRNLALALGTLLAGTSLYGQTTGFNKTTAGPHDYNETGNWVGTNINGIWHSTLTLGAAQTTTFNADTALTSGWAFGYGGNFGLTLQSDSATPRAVTLGGDVSVTTAGGTSANVTIGNATNALNVNLGGATRTMSVNASRSLTFLNTVSNGSIIKSGAGTLSLAGANTYTGTTAIDVGTVLISNNTALGTTAGNTTIAATGSLSTGGQLQLTGGISTAENITITGSTDSSSNVAAIQGAANSTNTLSGNIILSSLTGGIRIATGTAGAKLNFTGNISQTGSSQALVFLLGNAGGQTITVDNAIALNGGDLIVNGNGSSLILKGVNATNGSGIGNTTINGNGNGAGIQLGVTNAINTTATLSVDGGNFNLAGFDQTVNALTSTSTAGTVRNTVAGTRTLTVGNGGGSGTFGGTIITGTGNIELTKTGIGTQILAGNSTYTGETLVSAGTLLVNGSLGASAVTVDGGAFGGTGAIGSSLDLVAGSFHVADLADALQVAGTVSIYSGFGVDDLAGITWGSVIDGTYTLIDGTLGTGVFDGLAHNSFETRFDIGGGRGAYFEEGSLQLVVTSIPEPSAALLCGFGALALLRRRN